MKYLGIESSELVALGAIHTATEIVQQPEIWREVSEDIRKESPAIQKFLSEALKNSSRILLTGAGTSAFIGLSLRGTFQRNTGITTEAVASTDIVSHPRDYFSAGVPTLMISFARSGNSPESVAAMALADEICEKCYHLIITCNADGKLATYNTSSGKYVFTLPKRANDQSLAMTSSYSGMLLTGLLISRINTLSDVLNSVGTIIQYGQRIISEYAKSLREIAERDFKRAVFLGAGPIYGTAIESHLKLQELTDGKVICKNDSFLGFRHGPKAVIDETTLVVYFFSNNNYAYQYEKDLMDDMKKGTPPMLEVGISEPPVASRLSYLFSLSENRRNVEEDFLPVCYVIFAQILGFYKSIQLGLRPDAPSASGAITRVVQGVEIYVHSSLDLKINPVL